MKYWNRRAGTSTHGLKSSSNLKTAQIERFRSGFRVLPARRVMAAALALALSVAAPAYAEYAKISDDL